MGTGKSAVGRGVAARLGLRWLDTDELIERRAGVPISEIFAQHGEEHFRDLESAALAEALASGAQVLSTGGGALLRPGNLELLQAAGPIVCLHASAEEILSRTAGDDTRPLLRGGDRRETIQRLLAERAPVYAQADYQVDTTGMELAQVVEQVVAVIAQDPRAKYLTGQPLVIPVAVPGAEYEVTVGWGLLARVGEMAPPPKSGLTAVVVSGETVARIYGGTVVESLQGAGWQARLITVPDGEAAKSLEQYARLVEDMARAGLDRGGCVFALGGGVVGDLAGFAAATYMRGVKLVHLPTTLLAQVDSSIGGKTGVDLAAGKNLVGAFHQPVAVIADVAALRTLPAAELRSGLGEIIKHACCFDAELFEFLARHRDALGHLDAVAATYLVGRNCQIKAQVVAADPTEQGLRAVLNYGHTVGHALERAAGEWELRHGEVVAAGIVAEARLAQKLGVAEESTVARQEELIAACGLPVRVAGVQLERAREALRHDKKVVGGRLRMPLVPEIGSYRLVEDVPLTAVEEAMRSVIGEA